VLGMAVLWRARGVLDAVTESRPGSAAVGDVAAGGVGAVDTAGGRYRAVGR
jgi:hypothetical protein